MINISSVLNRVGSVFRQDFDIDKEKGLLYEELRTIADLKERMADPVWEKLFNTWKARTEVYGSDIIRLAENAKKNADEIQWKAAVRRGLIDLFDMIDKTLAEESIIISKLRNIEEITRETQVSNKR